MGDPVFTTVVGVGAALTKMFLRACDAALAADLVGDGQELLGTLLHALRRTDESRGQIERRVSQTLAHRIQAMQERGGSQSINPGLLTGASTEVEIILDEIANDNGLLLSAVRSPDSFPEKLRDYAAGRRTNVESAAEPYFDELIEAVATQYATFAPWSPKFEIEAFKSVLSGIDEINDKSRRSLQAHKMTHEMLDTVLSNLAAVTRHEDKPRRMLFGSRPDVTNGGRFVARVEQDQLNELITDTTKQRTVLVGMRGCGKTQLAAALAMQCEDANWSLVAWVNAVSPESIKSALVELAKELKIDTSDQPTQEQIIGRCLNHLRSSEASDRLVVFDNVEDINDLRGLVPTGDGLRVVATTTNNTGWEYQAWTTIKVGVFNHNESIDYLLTVTKSDDHDTADVLAERLGDLPLALAQAAATARNGDLSLGRYLDRLDSYSGERAIRPVPGGYYADDVATALCMAIEDALENLADPTRRYARRQLGALALLAESGVPTRWLDPTIEQQDNQGLQGAHQVEDEDAHDALTELIRRSIIQQSADKATTMLHRLQAQAFRESWSQDEQKEALEATADLLGSVSIDSARRSDAYRRQFETLNLIRHLRHIGTGANAPELLADQRILESINRAFNHAEDLLLTDDAITLQDIFKYLVLLFDRCNSTLIILRAQIASAYKQAGRANEVVPAVVELQSDCIETLGHTAQLTLVVKNLLAGIFRDTGRFAEAIDAYEQLISNTTDALGPNSLESLTIKNNLAVAYAASGDTFKAIDLHTQSVTESTQIFGPTHPATLTVRNNLAAAMVKAGMLKEALSLYSKLADDSIATLGISDLRTIDTRNDLAHCYTLIQQYDEATALYEDNLETLARTYGEQYRKTQETETRLRRCCLLQKDT